MTLAAKAKITASKTFPIKVHNGHAIAVKRFDRVQGFRTHAQSAKVALRAAGSRIGYPELAQLLRRRSSVENNFAQTQMRELFRRMVFNILMDNTDDHERNHVVLLDDANYLRLSPAFDVLPTCQSLGYQQMRVGAQENDSSIENALSEAAQFGLSRKDAVAEASAVAVVCSTWKEHFSGCGVSGNNIEAIAAHIDRPHLADQRRDVAESEARIAQNKKAR
jgi:serine/threonine-protein kinase HipA